MAAVLLLCAGMLSVLPPASAEDKVDQDAARRALEAGEVVPLRQITDVVTRQFTGEMVEAELEHTSRGWFYEITLLTTDGTILRLYYGAKSKALVQARGHSIERWYKGDPATLQAALSSGGGGGAGPDEDSSVSPGSSSEPPLGPPSGPPPAAAQPGGFWTRLFGKGE